MDNGNAYRAVPGRCTRCTGQLNDSAIIVRERVYWTASYMPVQFWSVQHVPVCSACASPSEAAQATRSIVCAGCGMMMETPLRWRGRHCSERCEQRVRRLRHAAMAPQRRCVVCDVRFPGRADAVFCSAACKQRDYRARRVGAGGGSQLSALPRDRRG